MPQANPLRIIFAGTPEFAATALAELINNGNDKNLEVIAVYTQPDRPAGRGRQLKASPVKDVALQHAIDVYQPENFKSEQDLKQLKELNADLMVVAAYGIILPLQVLTTPRLGCINIHASLLPRWRGAAPIQRAIAAGDSQTGITIMQMDEGLDTGDMLLTKSCAIEADDTGSSLHDKLAELGAIALLDAMDLIQSNALQPVKQDNALACYAHKLNKEEARINWQDKAATLALQVRAFNSWPVAQAHFENKTVRIWQAHVHSDTQPTISTQANNGEIIAITKQAIIVQCEQSQLAITDIQLAGAKRMSVSALLNGRPDFFKTGQCFS